MKQYLKIKIECYSYQDMLNEYEANYKADYQLIGYYFSSLEHKGELVMYPRKKGSKN